MRPRIYLSGPLALIGHPHENIRGACDAARVLILLGYAPFMPHLSYRIDPNNGFSHKKWMEIDLPWVDVADAVLRLPGDSLGADIEVAYAEKKGIPVFETIEKLIGAITISPRSLSYGYCHTESHGTRRKERQQPDQGLGPC